MAEREDGGIAAYSSRQAQRTCYEDALVARGASIRFANRASSPRRHFVAARLLCAPSLPYRKGRACALPFQREGRRRVPPIRHAKSFGLAMKMLLSREAPPFVSRTAHLPLSATLWLRGFSVPPLCHTEKAGRLPCLFCMAEREGFEPSLGY